MMSYHDYKTLHLVGLLFFLMALTRFHFSQEGKFFKSFLLTTAFFTVSSGTVLMFRWGLDESIPVWIWGKFIISIGLVASIWFPKANSGLVKYRSYVIFFMVFIGVYCSVYKPF